MEFLFNKTTVICGSQNTSKSYTVRNLLERLAATDNTYDIWIVDPNDELDLTYPMGYQVRDATDIDLDSDKIAVIVMDNPYDTMAPELEEIFLRAIMLRKRVYMKIIIVQESQMLSDTILERADNMIFSDGLSQKTYMSNVDNQRFLGRHKLVAPLHVFKALLTAQGDQGQHDTRSIEYQPRTIHMMPAIPPPRLGSRGNSFG